ncbi:MAG: KEOPS complex subunit Pcc1 [Euryarchaeota archaeon]|nr:KEOPS complex subunit Pcc1 [Euryarchaeota archaeon]
MQKKAAEISSFFRDNVSEFEKIYIISHNDTDGITACALLRITLSRFKEVEAKMLPQIYSATLEELKEEVGNNLIVFSDLGSSFCSEIAEKFKYSIILDHHPPKDCEGNVLNPHLFGYNGARDLSGAGAAYLFCKNLYPAIRQYSYLAIVGAIGDKQNEPFQGINLEILKDGKGVFVRNRDNIHIKNVKKDLMNGKYFSSLVNACGTLDKEDLGLQVCLQDEKAIKEAKKLFKTYNNELTEAVQEVLENKEEIVEENKSKSAYFIRSPLEREVTGPLSTLLIEEFNDKPVILISQKETLKVSARGTKELISQGLHLGKALKNAVGRKGEGGGHDIASGAKYHGETEEFIEKLDFEIKKQLGKQFLLDGELIILYDDGEKAASVAEAINVDNEEPLKTTTIESYNKKNEFRTHVRSENIGTFKNVIDDILVCIKSSEIIEE